MSVFENLRTLLWPLRVYDSVARALLLIDEAERMPLLPTKKQPAPKANDSRPIWEMVIEDMKQRDLEGRKRYGVPLQAGNGRDALQDAYEEALDLAVYLRQAIEER